MTTVYSMDFGSGKLVPLSRDDPLPVGSLVTYGDCANPRKQHCITGATIGEYGYGQKCVCADGHTSMIHASEVDKHGRDSNGGWHFVRGEDGEPVILDAAAMAEFVRVAALEKTRLDAERAEAESAKAKSDTEERAAIILAHPYLERVGATKKSGHALAAANIKRLLAREFPGVAFSAKSDSFSGGDSVDVSWTDGPTSEAVDRFADRFQDSDFDSMQDLSESRDSVWPEIFGGAKYVHCHRHVSPETTVRVALEMGHVVTPGQYGDIHGVDEETRQMIFREARGRSYYERPVAAPAPAAAPVASPDGVTVTENEEKNGVEIRFPAKPAASVLDALKAAGWRWSRFSSCWYAKRTPDALAFAKGLCG